MLDPGTMPRTAHAELHGTDRIGWLRAAVLGANDGIVSTASLMVGVAAASSGRAELLVAGMAGIVGGAMSMAAGEYVSVRSQSDAEQSDLRRERAELAAEPVLEERELASIYVARGLTPALAAQVAKELTQHGALAAHARDELGMSAAGAARPVQAALVSAASFAVGAALPVLTTALAPAELVVALVGATSIVLLAGLGALAARLGRAPMLKASVRVTVLGALAMGLTAVIGKLFGAAM